MLTIVRHRAGDSLDKPSEVVRGPASRLPWAWDSLCFAVPMNEPTLDGLRDLIGGGRGIINVAFPNVWVRDNRGNAAWHGQLAWSLVYPDNPENDKPSTELTAYVRLKRYGLGNVFGGMLANRYDAADPWLTWGLTDDSAASGKVSATLTVGGVNVTLPDTGTLPTTEYCSAFLRWRSGEVPRIDVLGERGNTITSSVGGAALTGTLSYNTGQGILINSSEAIGSSAEADYSQCMVWSRRLGDVEVAALVADSFGWYAPQEETVTVAAPFPVGPGMASPGMLSIR